MSLEDAIKENTASVEALTAAINMFWGKLNDHMGVQTAVVKDEPATPAKATVASHEKNGASEKPSPSKKAEVAAEKKPEAVEQVVTAAASVSVTFEELVPKFRILDRAVAVEMLQRFGVKKLSELLPAQYADAKAYLDAL